VRGRQVRGQSLLCLGVEKVIVSSSIYSGLFLGTILILVVTALVESTRVLRAWTKKVDSGLVTSWNDITSSFLDWFRIILAYGERGWIIQYIGVLMLHLGVVLEVIAHTPHIMALLNLSPRPLHPVYRPLAIVGLFIGVIGFLATIAFTLVYRETLSKITLVNRVVVGLVFIAAYFELLIGAFGVYHPLMALIALLSLAFTRCKHFILSAWLRPILAISKLLARNSTSKAYP